MQKTPSPSLPNFSSEPLDCVGRTLKKKVVQKKKTMLVARQSSPPKGNDEGMSSSLEELRGALEFSRRDLAAWSRERQKDIEEVRRKSESSLSLAARELSLLESEIAEQKDAACRARETTAVEAAVSKGESEVARLRREVRDLEIEKQRLLATTTQGLAASRNEVDNFQRLGLDLEGAGDGALRLRFTLLDKREPARAFTIFVAVDDDDKYKINGSSPALPEDVLEDELRNLNETNDFATFVRATRRHFLALCA